MKTLDPKYGVEIDIRGYGDTLLLNHDPIHDPSLHDNLESYLKVFSERGMSFIIFNTKEAGYEARIIALAEKYNIPKNNYFLLDVEYPYMYKATRKEGIREIAVRYSEGEPIEAVEAQALNGAPLVDWVWIDTNTTLPLNEGVVRRLSPFKTCLVCPERWGRPYDIPTYKKRIKELGLKLDAVMTAENYITLWETE
jgi:hypothetical protein